MMEELDVSNLCISIQSKGYINKYPAKAHARRIAEQLHDPNALIALSATSARNWPNSDMPAPFRQDRYFYYITGCNEPGCHVTYDTGEDRLTLWLPTIDKARVVWYGRGSTVEEAMDLYDIDEARYINDKKDWRRKCHRIARHSNEDTQLVYMRGKNKSDPSHSLRRAFDACRVIKDDHEIELIRRANAITADAHVNVLKNMHTFDSESQVEAAYMQVCIAKKAKEQAYDPIAGSGPNAAELHYSSNIANFGKGQTLVLDAGCEVERYASDVTRTIPINAQSPGHWPSKESKQIYGLVEKIQETCIEKMIPGNKAIELFWLAHEMVIEGLLDLGILKDGSVEDIFTQGTSRAFLPHGLGHHVGLDVHDVSPVSHPPVNSDTDIRGADEQQILEAFKAWRPQWASAHASGINANSLILNSPMIMSSARVDAAVLEPGMVVTVEPGIYFNKFLIDEFFLKDPMHKRYIDTNVLGRYMQVGGIRIEDDILITRTGYENLTTAPKGEAMLAVIRESVIAS